MPKAMQFVQGFGAKPAVTEIIMTEPAKTMTAGVAPVAVPQTQAAPVAAPQIQAAPVAVPQTQAAPVAVALREPLVTVAGSKAGSMAVTLGAVRAKAAGWITVAKAQVTQWQAAPPLWLIASLLAAIILLLVLFLLRKMGALGGARSAKATGIDPFERLLQRRLAEKARAEKAVMGGMGLLRA